MDKALLAQFKSDLVPGNVENIPINFGKFSRAGVVAAFELIGGIENFAEWAEDNPSDFYTKIFPKLIGREEAKIEKPDNVEDLLTVLDGEAEDITEEVAPEPDAPDPDNYGVLQISETEHKISDIVAARLARRASIYAKGEPKER